MNRCLSALDGCMRPMVLHVGPGNCITGELVFAAAGYDERMTEDGAQWRLKTTCAAVTEHPDAVDVEFIWTLEKGPATRCAVAVVFDFTDWASDNYVFAPAAVYNGNRFAFADIPWPTSLMVATLTEQRLDMPTTVNDCPRLKPDGPGRIDLATGSTATPLLGFYSAAKKRGWMVMTTQGNRLGNHGLTVEEKPDHRAASFRITSPAIRQSRAGGSHLVVPSGDDPVDWKVGDSAGIRCRIHTFAAPSITGFLRRFQRIRKDLSPIRRVETLPFSAAWKLLEAFYQDHRWDEAAGLYRLNDPRQEHIVQIWQLGSVGGGQVTLPLLQLGDAATRERAWRNLDTIFAKNQAKSGFFYTPGDGNPFLADKPRPHLDHDVILLRKNADWLYLAQRQFQVIEAGGGTIPNSWRAGLRRLADAFARVWQEYGQFGQWADVETGELKVGGSTHCAILCGALAMASITCSKKKLLVIAGRSARKYYRDFVRNGYTCGGPAEALSAPDSESAFALLESFMTLHEITGGQEWLHYAADLIPICASWTVSYDYQFPPDSPLGKLRVRSCGSVWASVLNKHSAPGICTWSGDSLLKYYRASGDRMALDLLEDIAHGIMQYISRPDYRVGAMNPGGICERVNLSDWEGVENIGGNIFDSCSWCETAALLTVAQVPGLYVRPDLGEFTVFDHIVAEGLDSTAGWLRLRLSNPTEFPAAVRVLVESAADRMLPLPLLTGDDTRIIDLDPGAEVEVEFRAPQVTQHR